MFKLHNFWEIILSVLLSISVCEKQDNSGVHLKKNQERFQLKANKGVVH